MSTQAKVFMALAICAAFVLGGTAALFAVERTDLVPSPLATEPATAPAQQAAPAIGPSAVPAAAPEETSSVEATKKTEAPEALAEGSRKQGMEVAPASRISRTPARTTTTYAASERLGPLVRAGTLLDARLMTPISSRTSYVGQSVWAETLDDFYVNGRLAIPAHTLIHGEVVAAKAFDFITPARLEIEFTRIGTKATSISLLSPAMDRWAQQAYDLAVATPATRTGELALDAGYLMLLRFNSTTRM